MKLKTVLINEKEQIFLDGEAIENVTAYKLENSADSNEPAKLTVTMYVTVERVCAGVNTGDSSYKGIRAALQAHETGCLILEEEKRMKKRE